MEKNLARRLYFKNTEDTQNVNDEKNLNIKDTLLQV